MSQNQNQQALPCPEHIALQPLMVEEEHEAEAISGEPGFGTIIDRRLPLGPGFMEISLDDSHWFTDTA
jgi:hypothetical protein